MAHVTETVSRFPCVRCDVIVRLVVEDTKPFFLGYQLFWMLLTGMSLKLIRRLETLWWLTLVAND